MWKWEWACVSIAPLSLPAVLIRKTWHFWYFQTPLVPCKKCDSFTSTPGNSLHEGISNTKHIIGIRFSQHAWSLGFAVVSHQAVWLKAFTHWNDFLAAPAAVCTPAVLSVALEHQTRGHMAQRGMIHKLLLCRNFDVLWNGSWVRTAGKEEVQKITVVCASNALKSQAWHERK